jgi:transposase
VRKKKEPVQDIGIDETSSKKGHHYLTIVHDKATGNVIHVGIRRNTETIDNFYEAWQDHLWPAFIGSARKWLKDADSKICFHRFHVAGFFGKAVDQVRKREHHDLKADGNDLLKGTKYDWLRNGNTKRKHGQRRHGAIFLAGCVEAGYHQWLILQNRLKSIFMES